MFLFHLIPLQILIFALPETKGILPGIELTEDQKKTLAQAQEFCRSKTVNLEEHPYHAVVISSCLDYPHHGVIISDKYVLSENDPNPTWREEGCKFSVQVGTDAGDSRIANHEAKIIINGGITLFKLEKPIKFGRRAQKIEIADESPKSGEQATITILTEDPFENAKVIGYGVTLLSDQDCMRLVSDREPHDIQTCKNSLWIDYPKALTRVPQNPICTSGPYSTLIDKNGRLVGIGDYKRGFHLKPDRDIDGVLDLTRYRAIFQNYI